MLRFFLRILLAGFPLTASAAPQRTMTVATGIQTTLPLVFGKIYGYLTGWAVPVITAVFLVGAMYLVVYAGKSEKASEGKGIMINALIGLAVIIGAYLIFQTVLYLLLV